MNPRTREFGVGDEAGNLGNCNPLLSDHGVSQSGSAKGVLDVHVKFELERTGIWGTASSVNVTHG